MASARTRPIIEIVTITKYPRLALIIVALALAGQLQAQVDLPAPDVPVPENEQQTETAAPPELTPEAPVQICPYEEIPLVGSGLTAPVFNMATHFHNSGSRHAD